MCPSKEEEFNKILVSTISEVLDFSDVIMNFLELNTSFNRNNIMNDVGSLSVGLKEVFGDSGAILEDILVKRVYGKLNIQYKADNGTLEEKLKRAYDNFYLKEEIR